MTAPNAAPASAEARLRATVDAQDERERASNARIAELELQLAEAQKEVEMYRANCGCGTSLDEPGKDRYSVELSWLSQVNGVLVACLENYRSEHVFCVADPKERDSNLDHDPCIFCINADAALAEAQKEQGL